MQLGQLQAEFDPQGALFHFKSRERSRKPLLDWIRDDVGGDAICSARIISKDGLTDKMCICLGIPIFPVLRYGTREGCVVPVSSWWSIYRSRLRERGMVPFRRDRPSPPSIDKCIPNLGGKWQAWMAVLRTAERAMAGPAHLTTGGPGASRTCVVCMADQPIPCMCPYFFSFNYIRADTNESGIPIFHRSHIT